MLKRFGLLILLIAVVGATAAFQQISPVPGTENPLAAITYPPPVYTLRGEFEIRGTAAIEGMTSYFLEVTPLIIPVDPAQALDEIWLPISMASSASVFDGVLGVWDTTIYDDGLYSMRLTVTTPAGNIVSLVSPLRIENVLPPFVTPETGGVIVVPPVVVTQDPGQISPPVTTAPIGTATVNGNVRTGDTTAYSVVTALQSGQTVEVIGISSSGSGWWYIRLPDGREGFAAPSILNVTGDTSGLPRIAPPPPPVVQPTAVPTSVPASAPDAIIANARFDRALVQGQAFQIFVTVRNITGVSMPNTTVACNFTPQNQIFGAETGSIGPNGQVDVAITARLDSGGGANTTANCAVDVNNLVAEANEGNNFFNLTVPVGT